MRLSRKLSHHKIGLPRRPRVGDRVVCLDAQRTQLTEGKAYTIRDFLRRDYTGKEPPYLYVIRNDSGVEHSFAPERFRLLDEAKRVPSRRHGLPIRV